jgi:hypothetical protein
LIRKEPPVDPADPSWADRTAASDLPFGAKYHYSYIRPPQADPGITAPAPIIMPPHPSYPSAHSCISGGMTGVTGSMPLPGLRRVAPQPRRPLEPI